MASVRVFLAGDDQPDKPGLPVAELLAPIPLVCLAVLFVNDWYLKPTDLPRWLTGKLSDFAGLAVFPLVATAVFDLVLLLAWRLGATIDFTLRRWKLLVAIALTGGVFAMMKLVPEVALLVARLLGVAFAGSRVMPDPTDLVALPALAIAWWWGRKTIARGAYGRLAWAARKKPRSDRSSETLFADAVACGADAAIVDGLEAASRAWIDGGPIEPVRDALARLRAPNHHRKASSDA